MTVPVVEVENGSTAAGGKLSTGRYRCLHSCEDRSVCGHKCCRKGLKHKPEALPVQIANQPGATKRPNSKPAVAYESQSRSEASPSIQTGPVRIQQDIKADNELLLQPDPKKVAEWPSSDYGDDLVDLSAARLPATSRQSESLHLSARKSSVRPTTIIGGGENAKKEPSRPTGQTTSRFFTQPEKRRLDQEDDDLKTNGDLPPTQRLKTMECPTKSTGPATQYKGENDQDPDSSVSEMDDDKTGENQALSHQTSASQRSALLDDAEKPDLTVDEKAGEPVTHNGLPAWLFDDDDFSKIVRKKAKSPASLSPFELAIASDSLPNTLPRATPLLSQVLPQPISRTQHVPHVFFTNLSHLSSSNSMLEETGRNGEGSPRQCTGLMILVRLQQAHPAECP